MLMTLEVAPATVLPRPINDQWTYEDYRRLPDDGRRYEIIDGVLYVSNAPGSAHQLAVGEIYFEMRGFVKAQQLGQVIVAPFEVHLSPTTRPVQPDVLFVRAERWPADDVALFKGAPDLIVEVLSPSTARTDRFIKFGAYEAAGVPEYWIADPILRMIEVYTLENGEYSLLGVFTQEQAVQSRVLSGFGVPCNRLFGR